MANLLMGPLLGEWYNNKMIHALEDLNIHYEVDEQGYVQCDMQQMDMIRLQSVMQFNMFSMLNEMRDFVLATDGLSDFFPPLFQADSIQ